MALVVVGPGSASETARSAAIADAQVVAATLERIGFAVDAHEDPSSRDLAATVATFERGTEPGDTVLLFFTGDRGAGAASPGATGPELDGGASAASAHAIAERLSARRPAALIVVFGGGRFDAANRKWPADSIVLQSGPPDREAAPAGLAGGPSRFARALALNLAVPGLTLADIAERTGIESGGTVLVQEGAAPRLVLTPNLPAQ